MAIYVAARSEAHLGTTHFATARGVAPAQLRQFSGAWYAPGSRVTCSHREIPQVGETYASVGVGLPRAWGFEAGVNEHGVAVGWEPIATRESAPSQAGLDGGDLTRLGLERGRNARESLEVVAALIERFGHTSPAPGNATPHDVRIHFADPGEAWSLESAGRRWVARRTTRRVPVGAEGEATAQRPEIRDDWDLSAKGLDAYAREHRGFEGPGRLDFAALFSPEAPAALDPSEPGGGIGSVELADALRAARASAGSFFVGLPHDRQRPWPLWICAGPAPVGVMLPVYASAALPCESREPGFSFDALADIAADRADLVVPRIREAWKSFEAEVERERRGCERDAAELAAAGREAEAGRTLAEFCARIWARASQQATELASALLR